MFSMKIAARFALHVNVRQPYTKTHNNSLFSFKLFSIHAIFVLTILTSRMRRRNGRNLW